MQVMERRNTAKRELTLTDRLSRLSYPQACKLLGSDGRGLIQRGGAWEIDIDEHVYLRGDLFRLSLDDAVVTITTKADVPQRLRWNCTRCTSACEHVGAAFSLVLEEKMALVLCHGSEFGLSCLLVLDVSEDKEVSRCRRSTLFD